MQIKKDSFLYKMLSARGLQVFSVNQTRDLFIPSELDSKIVDEFYIEMGRYSFRLLLRDIIKKQDSFSPEDLARFSIIKRVKEDLAFLLRIGLIVEKGPQIYKITHGPVKSFGETLEWYVSEVIRREFSGDVIRGVKFKGSEHGGDYDVVASMGTNLVYIEVKSSPPKHIMQEEVGAFFDRVFDLLPDFAVLLMDTELRMKDKLVPMFEIELTKRYGVNQECQYSIDRLINEIFHIKNRIFIMNTKRSLAENLRLCYRAYLKSRLLLPSSNPL